MRITLSQLILLLVLTVVSYAAPSKAQGVLNNTVSLSSTKSSLQGVLKKIEKAADVKFVYSRNVIDADQQVSVQATNEKLSQVLDHLLLKRGINYELINQQIVLSKGAYGPDLTESALQEALVLADIIVKGTVTSANGETLPGVSIKIKGSNLGTTTDVNGTFTLRVPSNQANAVLVFTYLGFLTQEVAVKERTSINIQMKEDVKTLEEVVVVGYNTVKKSDVTGAVTRVGTKEIEQMPVQNAVQAMQGRAAGVDISSNSRPGEVGSIRIRGNRSLLASNEPLYVVDGMPLAAGGIESINPHDIESIDVLKDASATAVYGSRGANGVVMVTTKKGKSGAAQITYNVITTFDKINNLDEMFDAGEYAEYRRDAYRALPATSTSRYAALYANPVEDKRILGGDASAWEIIAHGYEWEDKDNLIPKMRTTTEQEKALWGVDQVPVYDGSKVPTTNWGDLVSRTGITQDHTLGVSMGTEKLTAYFSAGYLNQLGITKDQDFNRYNAKASFDLKPNKWFSIGGTITGTWSKQNYGYAGSGSRGARSLYAAARGMLPFTVPYDENGEFIQLPGADVSIINPILEPDNVTNERTTLRALGSFYSEIKFLKNLKYRVNFGPDFRNYRIGQFYTKRSILSTGLNSAGLDQRQNFAWTLDHLLYYNKTFNDKHALDLTLLQSSTFNREETSSMSARDLPYDSQKWYNLRSVSSGSLSGWGSGFSKNTLSSYMARINYTFSDKYILTASSRWDGASVLADGNKWDYFPALALGWRLEREPFMKGITWITQLKPRFGVGTTGNSAIAAYETSGNLVLTPIVFGNQVSMGYVPSDPKAESPPRMPNYDLRWEKTTQWNAGLDFGFLKGRITGYLDFYTSRTSGLLMNRSIPSPSGYTRIYYNVGKTANKGVDLTLSTINVNSSNFRWNTDLAISTNRDEIVELFNGKNDAVDLQYFIGEPINVVYDYKKIGIWQTADAEQAKAYGYKPGDIRVQDINNDGKIDPNNDRVILGTRYPKWTSGITNTFSYKGIELSAFVYARWGFLIEGGAPDLQGRFSSRKVDYWTPDNPTNEYPRADNGNGGQPIHYSAMNYQNGSFVKVKNISLGYVLPKALIQKVRVNNLRVYAQVLNPFIYTKNGFIDPDVNFTPTSGFVPNSGGSTRSFVLGLNTSF